MGDLDDKIKIGLAALSDKLANPPRSGGLEDSVAFANLAKEGLEEVAKQLLTIADEDVVGFHPTPIAGVCCALA
jgi:hypothetical protein